MYFDGFPFGGMPGMGGGMPGGMGGMPGMGRRGDVDTSKFYDLLGVSKDADTSTIKKAFRKLALTHHPDRGGDAEKFKEISKAHEVLSDPEKRKLYDQVGEEGLENGGGGGGGADPSDLFSHLFGGGGGRGPQRPRRGEDVVHEIKVPLAQLYTGTSKKMALFREILCKTCKGNGTKDGKTMECSGCNGRGRRKVIQRLGNMIAQQEVACSDCRGKGTTIAESNKCGECKASCIVKEKELLQVEIEKGMRNAQKVVFKGKGDERPGVETGDVVFVIQEEAHPIFKRTGEHLAIEHKITLLEALTGFKFVITHLDGRKLLINSQEGKVYKPGDKLVVKGEGMPIHGRSHTKGHLAVTLNIEFPTSINTDDFTTLSSALPKGADLKIPDDAEVHFLENAGNIDLSGKASRNRNAYDDDDDDEEGHHGHGHGPQVGCTQA